MTSRRKQPHTEESGVWTTMGNGRWEMGNAEMRTACSESHGPGSNGPERGDADESSKTSSTSMNRRQALISLTAGGVAMALHTLPAAETRRTRLGVVIYGLGIHQKHDWAGRHQGLSPALAFLEECHRFGAGGIQFQLGPKDKPHLQELRQRAERHEMYFEAIISPPTDADDVSRFEEEVRLAKEAGARVARTVIIPGRRYEQFKTLTEFREYEKRGLKSLQLAEPVVARHRLRFAVENHKDQLIAEKLETLRRVGSEWIGLCVDVGNNLALMEDPLETVRAFAPYALTVHLKDMALREYADGWLLADVALGDGLFDLRRMVEVLRAANPAVKFNYETITRDALKVPVNTEPYWATLPGPRTEALKRIAAIARSKPDVRFPDDISRLSIEQQVEAERRNVERSLAYASEHLAL